MKKYLLAALLSLCLAPVWAQENGQGSIHWLDRPVPQKEEKELQVFALFYNQWVNSNLQVTQPFFQGQVIGRLFGSNTTTTHAGRSSYFEQRLLPFFIYRPKLLDGRVLLRTSFEIDWTWGDNSYGAAGNQGAAIAGDMVNLQTQNVELEFLLNRGWTINMGLQRMFDNGANPYRALFDELTSTGYRLTYWGTDGVGINIRRDRDFYRYSLGFYQLYENDIHENDDATLTMFNYERDLTKRWTQGVSAWYVQDRANGQGGAIGNGPGSALAEMNGAYRFSLGATPFKADVVWLGTHGSYNAGFHTGRLLLSGYVNANLGNIRTDSSNALLSRIAGVGANLRAGYKYGQTSEDAVFADLIYTSGDKDFTDKRYTGVITGNTWGTPAAIFINHGAYLLFTHGNVVNRFAAAVNDISNAGYGLVGGTVNFHRSLIKNRLDAKLGGAYALANAQPAGGGRHMGTELNFKLRYVPKVFMDLELHTAYLALGNFYDSPVVNGNKTSRPLDPWTVLLVYRWLIF